MLINNRMTSLVYKLILIFVCLVGLLMTSGVLNGTFAPYVLLYYSIESNLLCLVFYIISAIVTGLSLKDTGRLGAVRFAPHFKGGIVMAMLFTMLIYFFLLSIGSASGGVYAVTSNIIVHIAVPLMVLADWILFDRKGRFGGSDPVIWMVIPFAYYIIVLVAAQLGVQYYDQYYYPYSFIDPDRIRWAPVLLNVFLLTMGFMLIGYLLRGIDRLLGNRAKKRALQAAAATPDAGGAPESKAAGTPAAQAPAAPMAASAPAVANAPSAASTAAGEKIVYSKQQPITE